MGCQTKGIQYDAGHFAGFDMVSELWPFIIISILTNKECRHARYKTALHGNYRLMKKLSGYVKGEEA